MPESDDRIIIDLPEPKEASHETLPHAAMGLGRFGGANMRPSAALVHRIVIEKHADAVWMLHRLDNAGGYIGDSAHPSKNDALRQAKREFGIGRISSVETFAVRR